jgi:hypothetical protein
VQTRLEDPEGAWIEVVGPLAPSSQVATSGMSQLADRTVVTIREPLTDVDDPDPMTDPAGDAPEPQDDPDPAPAETDRR